MEKENVNVGNKKRVVIPEFARPARTRGSPPYRYSKVVEIPDYSFRE